MNEDISRDEDPGNDGFTLVQCGRRHSRFNKQNRANGKKSIIGGSGQNINNSGVRGVEKLIDVFVGRVDVSSNVELLESFIKDNFNVSPVNIELLNTRSTDFKCYKIKVKLEERNSLFNPSLWPIGVVIDKYYNKSNRS